MSDGFIGLAGARRRGDRFRGAAVVLSFDSGLEVGGTSGDFVGHRLASAFARMRLTEPDCA
jgi:hypothetical protein